MPHIFAKVMVGLFIMFSQTAYAEMLEDFLQSTKYVDSNHPAIIAAVRKAIGSEKEDTKKAIKIHDFVRDEIVFGWSSAFYDQSASQVLISGTGFCNTKGTLFTAMLRAAGIPARQHFVNIDAEIVSDFISPGTRYVDHSYTEVYLDDMWLKVDSYIVDSVLFQSAKTLLKSENRGIGYGVHQNGNHEWNGKEDSFVQYVDDGLLPDLSNRSFGIYSDVGAFYASGNAINELGVFGRLFFSGARILANRKIEQLREKRS